MWCHEKLSNYSNCRRKIVRHPKNRAGNSDPAGANHVAPHVSRVCYRSTKVTNSVYNVFSLGFFFQSQKVTSPPCSSEKILSPPSSSHSRQKLTKRSQSDPFLLDKICPASSPLSYSTEYSAVSPTDTHTSDTYIYWVLCFCALAAVLQNLYLLIIVILFELVYLVKKMCK